MAGVGALRLNTLNLLDCFTTSPITTKTKSPGLLNAATALTVHTSDPGGWSGNKTMPKLGFVAPLSSPFARFYPLLQRNSRPAGCAEGSVSPVIPVSLWRFLSKQPWNLSRLKNRRSSRVSATGSCFSLLGSAGWGSLARLSASLRAQLLFPLPSHSDTHTGAEAQGSRCAEPL